MYHEGLVVVVKSNGKILRENKDEVYLPFGSEYAILLKNLETRKALVKISIDGADVLDGNSLIIDPNTETNLEGFMKGSIAKNKFKFIKKTKEISDHRGDRIDDGIIRVEYWFEQLVEKKHIVTEHVHHFYNYYNCNNNCTFCCNWECPHRRNSYPYKETTYWYGTRYGGTSVDGVTQDFFSDGKGYNNLGAQSVNNFYSSTLGNIGSNVNKNSNVEEMCSKSILREQQVPDEGITVKGSETYQAFRYANIGPLEDTSKVILLRLIGSKESGQIIKEPVTVKTKKSCPTCGRRSKSHLKFCSSCGTFLE